MIGARWADATVGGFRWNSHAAFTQDEKEVSIEAVCKALNVGERGIYHARNILENGTPEEIAACDSGEAAITTTSKKISARDYVKLHKEKPRRSGASRLG